MSTPTATTPNVVGQALAPFYLGHRPSLDGLRGFAVLIVMAHHASVPGFAGGAVGVDIFFVLSGFLISSLLFEEWRRTGDIRLRTFYLRRCLRLLPALFAFLLFLQAYTLLLMRGEAFWQMEKASLGVLTYGGNWLRAYNVLDMRVLSHTWSLSIEEQFYVLWPLLLLTMLRFRPSLRWIMAALLLAILFIAARRWFLVGIVSTDRIYNGSDTRCDELLTGCALALILAAGMLSDRVRSFLAYLVLPSVAIVLAFTALPVGIPKLARFGWPAIEISMALVMLYLVTRSQTPLHRVLEIRWLVWTGRISYGLYLWHFPIIGRVGGWHFLGRFTILVGFALTFAFAALSYRVIELPFLRRKAKMQAAGRVPFPKTA